MDVVENDLIELSLEELIDVFGGSGEAYKLVYEDGIYKLKAC